MTSIILHTSSRQDIFTIAEICTLPTSLCAERTFSSKVVYNRITELAIRTLTLLISIFAIPLYLVGKIIKLFQPKSDNQEVIPMQAAIDIPNTTAQVATNRLAITSPTQRNQNEMQQRALTLASPAATEIQVVASFQQVVNGLANNEQSARTFCEKTSFEDYKRLPILAQYLVAGRYYYNTWGWSLTTSYTLLKKFENEFQHKPNLMDAKQAIVEAALIWIRRDALLEIKQSQGRHTTLLSFDQEVIDQVYWHVAHEFQCTDEKLALRFGEEKFKQNPNHEKVTAALESICRTIEKAYAVDYRCSLRSLPPPNTQLAIQE